jgi:hypothetical protein
MYGPLDSLLNIETKHLFQDLLDLREHAPWAERSGFLVDKGFWMVIFKVMDAGKVGMLSEEPDNQ